MCVMLLIKYLNRENDGISNHFNLFGMLIWLIYYYALCLMDFFSKLTTDSNTLYS